MATVPAMRQRVFVRGDGSPAGPGPLRNPELQLQPVSADRRRAGADARADRDHLALERRRDPCRPHRAGAGRRARSRREHGSAAGLSGVSTQVSAAGSPQPGASLADAARRAGRPGPDACRTAPAHRSAGEAGGGEGPVRLLLLEALRQQPLPVGVLPQPVRDAALPVGDVAGSAPGGERQAGARHRLRLRPLRTLPDAAPAEHAGHRHRLQFLSGLGRAQMGGAARAVRLLRCQHSVALQVRQLLRGDLFRRIHAAAREGAAGRGGGAGRTRASRDLCARRQQGGGASQSAERWGDAARGILGPVRSRADALLRRRWAVERLPDAAQSARARPRAAGRLAVGEVPQLCPASAGAAAAGRGGGRLVPRRRQADAQPRAERCRRPAGRHRDRVHVSHGLGCVRGRGHDELYAASGEDREVPAARGAGRSRRKGGRRTGRTVCPDRRAARLCSRLVRRGPGDGRRSERRRSNSCSRDLPAWARWRYGRVLDGDMVIHNRPRQVPGCAMPPRQDSP